MQGFKVLVVETTSFLIVFTHDLDASSFPYSLDGSNPYMSYCEHIDHFCNYLHHSRIYALMSATRFHTLVA